MNKLKNVKGVASLSKESQMNILGGSGSGCNTICAVQGYTCDPDLSPNGCIKADGIWACGYCWVQ